MGGGFLEKEYQIFVVLKCGGAFIKLRNIRKNHRGTNIRGLR
jgi:hypothetical protein